MINKIMLKRQRINNNDNDYLWYIYITYTLQ